MIKTTRIIMVLFLFVSCKNEHKYEYWDISKFNLKPDALTNGQSVHLIYSSRNPNNNKDSYTQLVAVADMTHDTLNILSPVNIELQQEDKDSSFYFYDENNIITKSIENSLTDTFKSMSLLDTNKLFVKRRSKVGRDPQFDFIAENKFPTVIGMIVRNRLEH